MRTLTIAGRRIADDTPCYVIAEIGSTHQGSVDRARQLIDVAALCGVDAVKVQRKHVETLYSAEMLARPYAGLADTYGGHKRALEFSLSDLAALKAHAESQGITWFATPFDEASADDLAALDVPAFKVHSGGLTDTPLLRHLAGLDRPIVLSTGGGDQGDIDRALGALRGASVAILHCTAVYPVVRDEWLNLGVIRTLRRRYPEQVIGWSAHDVSPDRAGISHKTLAYGLGARIIEVHFTLDHELPGTDHQFALETTGLRKTVSELKHAHLVMGDGVKRFYDEERPAIAKMRRVETAEGWRITGEVSDGESTAVHEAAVGA